MIIGSVLELKESECRVGLIPEHAKAYVDAGHTVFVESGLGVASGFSDDEYKAVGAEVCASADEVWLKSDMIIKVKEPMACEYKHMREEQIIYTYFHLAANRELTDALIEHKVTAVAYETVENHTGELVLLKPMSEIAGKLAILEANKYLEYHYGGKGVLLSGTSTVEPAHVLIVGVGNVGGSALKEAYNLGASITALVRSDEDVKTLNKLYKDIEVLISNEENIIASLKKADVVVSSVLVAGAKTSQLIKRDYLKFMEDGTVIVDVAIDQGGSLETSRPTTHLEPVYTIDGVIHYCVANMAGAVPKTASKALGSSTLQYGLELANMGLENACTQDLGLRKGINVYKGQLVNEAVSITHDLKLETLKF